jgi:hypothetical protein
MRHLLLIIVLAALTLTACDKVEDNGDLAGQWQLQYMTSVATGDTLADKHSGIYYRISRELFSIGGGHHGYLSLFRYTGDSLFILPKPGSVADSTFTDFAFLDPLGVTPDGGFHVDALSSQHLALSNASYRLTFRKY